MQVEAVSTDPQVVAEWQPPEEVPQPPSGPAELPDQPPQEQPTPRPDEVPNEPARPDELPPSETSYRRSRGRQHYGFP
jgi:hypothetical protein